MTDVADRGALPDRGAWVGYRAPAPRPPYRRWWFWTGLALVLVAVIAAAAVVNVTSQNAARAAAWRQFRSHSHVVTLDIGGHGTAEIVVFDSPGPMLDHGASRIYEQQRLPFHLRTVVPANFEDYEVMTDADSSRPTPCRIALDGRRFTTDDGGSSQSGNCGVSADQAVG